MLVCCGSIAVYLGNAVCGEVIHTRECDIGVLARVLLRARARNAVEGYGVCSLGHVNAFPCSECAVFHILEQVVCQRGRDIEVNELRCELVVAQPLFVARSERIPALARIAERCHAVGDNERFQTCVLESAGTDSCYSIGNVERLEAVCVGESASRYLLEVLGELNSFELGAHIEHILRYLAVGVSELDVLYALEHMLAE